MIKQIILLILILALYVLVSCKKKHNEKHSEIIALPETSLEQAQKDFKEINKRYNFVDSPEEKVAELEKFIELHPNNDLTVFILDIIAIFKYEKDYLAKAEYIIKKTKGVTNKRALQEANRSVLLSYAKAGDSKKFKAYIEALDPKLKKIEVNEAICRGSAILDEAELLGIYSKVMKSQSNIDSLRNHPKFGNQEEAGIKWTAKRFYKLSETWEAKYLISTGEYSKAKALLAPQFSDLRTNFVGYVHNDLVTLFMAQLQFELQDYQSAMETIGPLAIFTNNKDAKALYKRAFIKGGGKKNELSEAIDKHRNRIAPKIPNFSALNLKNEKVVFGDINAKAKLLVFWDPSQGVARTVLQKLKPIYERYKDQDLEVVTVYVFNDVENVMAFKNKYQLDYIFLKNGQGDQEFVRRTFRVVNYPTTYLINKFNEVVYSLIYYDKGDELAIEQAIQQLLD